MDSKKKMTGMMIHGFAVAHAIAAAVLVQTLIGDEAVLTALTVAMIIAVARMNGADWDTGAALAFLGICIGGYVSKVRLLRKNQDHMQIVRTCICPQLNSGEEHDIRGFGA